MTVFRCPECGKLFRHEGEGEPMCTGPSEMRDDHEPTLMIATRVNGALWPEFVMAKSVGR